MNYILREGILTHLRSKLVLCAIKSNYKAASTIIIRYVVHTETFVRVVILQLWIHSHRQRHKSSGHLLLRAKARKEES